MTKRQFNNFNSYNGFYPLNIENTIKTHKLYSCNARIIETKKGFYLLSYSTYIGYYDKKKKEFDDVLRLVYGYTSTSSQHLAKFHHWLRERGYASEQYHRYYNICELDK